MTVPRSGSGPAAPPVLPIGAGEQRALGFGALYHPWLVITRSDNGGALEEGPPDGAVAGVMARRARTRGAWVAPANERLRDVVGLVRPAPLGSLSALQQAQVNAVRQEPEGFMCLAQDTLSVERDTRPINVRRLMALLRRLVLREGTAYLFEPNDRILRRAVERGFNELMQYLYTLGAFAGASAEQAFQVDVGDDLNTAVSTDLGRLIVELKFAPSQPLVFLLVRLVHDNELGFVLEAS